MNSKLRLYVEEYYEIGKYDLYTTFVLVLKKLLKDNGVMAIINQHAWMFTSYFIELRHELLKELLLKSMIHLGPRAFNEITGEVVQTTSFVLIKKQHEQNIPVFFRLVSYKKSELKQNAFLNGKNKYSRFSQLDFLTIPNYPLAYWINENVKQLLSNENTLSALCEPKAGLQTGNNELYLRFWHEIDYNKIDFNNPNLACSLKKFVPYDKGGSYKKWFGNQDYVINWEKDAEHMRLNSNPVFRNYKYYYKPAISYSLTKSTGFAFRYRPQGFVFDNQGSSIFPKINMNLLLGFLNSNVTSDLIPIFNSSMVVQVGDLSKIPITRTLLRPYENLIENKVKEIVSLVSVDNSKTEMSWEFQQHSLIQIHKPLAESYNEWISKVTADFFLIHSNEEELNCIFIKIYNFQEELTADVPLKDISILQDELDRKKLEQLESVFREKGKEAIELPIKKDIVIQQLISYAIGCMMGRYRLDKPGLQIAHPNPTEDEVCSYSFNGKTYKIDEDAIIPIMGSRCTFSDDAVIRLKEFLSIVWGEERLTENINFAEECLNKDIESYLVKDFWDNHCKMYSKRPIYWLFSSKKGVFQVLVYMHRMNKFTVEKIRSNYLLKHIQNLDNQLQLLKNNSTSLSRQEMKRMEQLQNDILECRDYDLYIKDMADKQIEFDLNDGVVENYKLFESVVAKIK